MGMDKRITAGPRVFVWQEFTRSLAAKNLSVQMRLIDGNLAYPDEQPPTDWRELRMSCTAGMITLRRDADAIEAVIWGNADPELQRCWQAAAEAVAEATGGQVVQS